MRRATLHAGHRGGAGARGGHGARLVTCKVRFPIELGLLLILCFFLPIYEAPKNLAWIAYVLVWAINRIRSRDAGGPWDAWDTLTALWIASGYVVAAFAGLHGQ